MPQLGDYLDIDLARARAQFRALMSRQAVDAKRGRLCTPLLGVCVRKCPRSAAAGGR